MSGCVLRSRDVRTQVRQAVERRVRLRSSVGCIDQRFEVLQRLFQLRARVAFVQRVFADDAGGSADQEKGLVPDRCDRRAREAWGHGTVPRGISPRGPLTRILDGRAAGLRREAVDDEVVADDAHGRRRRERGAQFPRPAAPLGVAVEASGVEDHVTIQAAVHDLGGVRNEIPEADRMTAERRERVADRDVRLGDAGAQRVRRHRARARNRRRQQE